MRNTRLLLIALIVVLLFTVNSSRVRSDAVYPVDTSCSVTDSWQDCAGMTWERESCTTTYNNGMKKTTTTDRPASWECWTCYMMYFC